MHASYLLVLIQIDSCRTMILSLMTARSRPVARNMSIWKKADFDTIKKFTVAFSDAFTSHTYLPEYPRPLNHNDK